MWSKRLGLLVALSASSVLGCADVDIDDAELGSEPYDPEEGEETAEVAVAEQPLYVDLSVTRVQMDYWWTFRGQELYIPYSYHAAGGNDYSAPWLYWFLSRDPYVSADDRKEEAYRWATMDPGPTINTGNKLRIMSDTPLGTWYVIVCIRHDYQQQSGQWDGTHEPNDCKASNPFSIWF